MKGIARQLKKLFSSLLPKRKTFSRIELLRDAAQDISEFAKNKYPDEFVAYLQGEVKEDVLVVKNLVYQPFSSGLHSATIRPRLPPFSDIVGSVHSHPSGNNSPSDEDLNLFSKGVIHMIVAYPYKSENIECYDSQGQKLAFRISE